MNKELIQTIKQSFTSADASKPVLVFSPGRINLIGEHTDYNDGFVFPAAIDKGIYLALNKSHTPYSRVTALDVNEQMEFAIGQIKPAKSGGWKNYVLGVVDEISKEGKQIKNFNMTFAGDIPQGAGLSSSAALENGIVFGLNELFQLGLSKKEMIFISQKAEQLFVGVNCGIMDQYASMFGQKDSALFLDCQNLEATHINLNLENYRLILINTNVKHSLAESIYNDRRRTCEKIASLLNFNSLRAISEKQLLSIEDKISREDYQKALYVIHENDRVHKAVDAINTNDIAVLGKLMFNSHQGLRDHYKVSCDELDFLVELARKNQSVSGARMMGGGFGGCTINLVNTVGIEEFSKDIKGKYKRKFNMECSIYDVNLSQGTHLIKN